MADETSFDKFHPKADRLYQVWVNAHFDGRINSWTSVPLPTAEAMKKALAAKKGGAGAPSAGGFKPGQHAEKAMQKQAAALNKPAFRRASKRG